MVVEKVQGPHVDDCSWSPCSFVSPPGLKARAALDGEEQHLNSQTIPSSVSPKMRAGLGSLSHLFLHPATDHGWVGFGFERGHISCPRVLTAPLRGCFPYTNCLLQGHCQPSDWLMHRTPPTETEITCVELSGTGVHRITLTAILEDEHERSVLT